MLLNAPLFLSPSLLFHFLSHPLPSFSSPSLPFPPPPSLSLRLAIFVRSWDKRHRHQLGLVCHAIRATVGLPSMSPGKNWTRYSLSTLSFSLSLLSFSSAQKEQLLVEEEDPRDIRNIIYCGYCNAHYKRMVRGRERKRERERVREGKLLLLVILHMSVISFILHMFTHVQISYCTMYMRVHIKMMKLSY